MRATHYPKVAGRNGPSFYAPPAAWAVAQFAGELIEGLGPFEMENFGLVVTSDECSLATVRALSQTLARGSLSPLRFAGSSPSILAGLTAIQLQIRGPTLCLTMPPEDAGPAIDALLAFWLGSEMVAAVMAVSHWPTADGGHLLRGGIFHRNQDFSIAPLTVRP